MNLRIFGANLLALAIAAPALAQTEAPAAGGNEQSVIDELAPAGSPDAGPSPAPTGDPIVDRLNALEYKLKALESRNAELETALETANGRIETVTAKANKGLATNGVVPTFSDPSGTTTFKVRGVIDVDQAAFNERAGGYDYNNGTAFRRARLGFEGTAFKVFNWRIEADFAGNTVNLQDAYVQYVGIKPLQITLGQHKAPFGLESNNSDNYNVFLERGIFNVAAGNLGAERKIGLSVGYVKPNLTLTAGVFGEGESIGRATDLTAPATPNVRDTPDEGWGFNARATWEPLSKEGQIVHLGAATYWRTGLRSATAVGARISDRPNIRVDNGNIIDSGVIADADTAFYYGAEAAAVFGPLTVAGEYGRLKINRLGTVPDPTFEGFYGYAAWLFTGESRTFKGGNYDRLKPKSNFDGKGGWGAWEVALRYDEADLSETIGARAGNKANTWTAGLNWYWNPNIKLQFNYIRFTGDNTPLDPVGAKTKGDVLSTRLHIDW